jgi:hypothetical protein
MRIHLLLNKFENKKILVFHKYADVELIRDIASVSLDLQFCHKFSDAIDLDLKSFDFLICDYGLGDVDFVSFIQEIKSLNLNEDFLIKFSSLKVAEPTSDKSHSNTEEVIDHGIEQKQIDNLINTLVVGDVPAIDLKEKLCISERNSFDIKKVAIFLIQEKSVVFSSRLDCIPDEIILNVGDNEFLINQGIKECQGDDEDKDDKHFFKIDDLGLVDQGLLDYLKRKLDSERQLNDLVQFDF